ncbi:hypothetical protein ACR2WD_27555, partial [Klebsiella pneumoniae]
HEFKEGVLVQKFERTVTNVGPGATKYNVKVKAPKGSVITVSPKTLVFGKMHEKKNYTLTIRYNSHEEWVVSYGSITWASNLEKSVPPGYLKFISNLENEILNVSMERETLKIEVMRAQAMINILQSRIDLLNRDNEELRRVFRDV